jgi:mono/diheme cytochrome c family protein
VAVPEEVGVTEIPEHLLRRSRERREALGLGGDGGGAEAGEGAAPAPAAASPAAAVQASAAPAAVAEAGAVAVVEEEAPTYLAPTRPARNKVPLWVMPVLIGLPLWAALYPGAFSNHVPKVVVSPLVDGQQVYPANCSACHGASGEGGAGPPLKGGQAVLTFPNVQDHINWVETGSQSKQGQKYGDPNRTGGQHVATKGDMPAFGGTLTQQQIQDVVMFERTSL